MMAARIHFDNIRKIIRISLALARTNFTLRNEGSYLGIAWYLLSPLALFAVMLFIKQVALSDLDIPFYPIYLLLGVTSLNFFRQVLTDAIRSISGSGSYLKSLNNVAPEVLVLSGIFQAVFSHVFELALIVGAAVYLGTPWLGLIFYLVAFLFFLLLVTGIALIFATIGAYVNDLDNIWVILSQLLFLATPTFYVATPGSPVYLANLANPLFYFLEIFRAAVISASTPPLWMMSVAALFSFAAFVLGFLVFNRYKRRFAELV